MDKLKMSTLNQANENYQKLVALFPNAMTEIITGYDSEGKPIVERAIDKEVLMQEINTRVVEGREERYQFTWPDKKKAMLTANAPIAATLRPVREESVGKDGTPGGWDSQNLYIEGDNLDVLKLLQETYLGKVKMIYIDPPYNTGNDFVYEDDFTEDAENYLVHSGQYDEQGNRMNNNLESNGRFHTDWLNMIYPRLRLAKNLMTDDGIIFISIDDAEVENLKKICDEIYGEKNFVACLVYDRNRKNDAKFFSVGHEYMLVYFRNISFVNQLGITLRADKEGVEEVKAEFDRLRKLYNDDWDKVNEGLKELYATWSEDEERHQLARYTRVDEKGPYRDDGNISWPGGDGPRYEVLHPVTGKPCKIPSRGWVYPSIERMKEEIANGRVVFGPDETTTPRIRTNLFEQDKKVMRSVMFSYAQTATQEFNRLFDNVRVFENPKSVNDIKKIVDYYTKSNEDAIILDFFSGSATTAHAILQLNSEDEGHRRFILIQLPEIIDPEKICSEKAKKVAKNAIAMLDSIKKPHNICEIGKERIRRAGRLIKEEAGLTASNLDVGFRVLRLDSSNMQDVYYNPESLTMDLLTTTVDNIKIDRMPEDLLFQVMLDLGVDLSSAIEKRLIDGKCVFIVKPAGVEKEYLVACFDQGITSETVTTIAKMQPYYAVFRDNGMASDSVVTNFDQIFRTYSPQTERKVL